MKLGSEGFEVQFFQIWAWVEPIYGQARSMFGPFEADRMSFKFRFVRRILGLSKFEVRPVMFEAVQSSLYLGSIQYYSASGSYFIKKC